MLYIARGSLLLSTSEEASLSRECGHDAEVEGSCPYRARVARRWTSFTESLRCADALFVGEQKTRMRGGPLLLLIA